MKVQVGDWINDWDYRFPAGPVVAVDSKGEWFEVEWERGGVRYVKRHLIEILADKPTEGLLVKV